MSNIWPQDADLNRMVWLASETANARAWSHQYVQLWVICGAIFDQQEPSGYAYNGSAVHP